MLGRNLGQQGEIIGCELVVDVVSHDYHLYLFHFVHLVHLDGTFIDNFKETRFIGSSVESFGM